MIGKIISHYRITEKIGEGGMGEVYKAEDTKLRRTVALKFLSSRILSGEDDKNRLIHEAQAAAALNHPNICTIHEIDEVDGQSFIAMEYVAGKSLKTMIESGPLKLDQVREIAIQIAEGLHEAHCRQIVHRDVKPANIMLTNKGRVKIMDFGLAKFPERAQLTLEGTTHGTLDYMSPEQAHGRMIDSRTDIWALGVLIYQMVTGMLPFRGDYEQAVIYSILNEDPEPLTALRTGVPVELERIAGKSMEKDPEKRYQHIDELLVDLKNLTVDMGLSALAGKSVRKGGRKIGVVLSSGAVIILISAFFLVRPYLFTPDNHLIDSIAVLPLDNLSRDSEQEYFADGMTEALIADLAKIASLKVISRTSVMRYKGTRKSIPEIARELDVDAIIEGSVMQVGGSVRITAQLIDAASDRHLWAESYERNVHDILALQSDVARAIANEINIKLAPREESRFSSDRKIDPGAYEAYLKGRYYWNKRTEQDIHKGIEYLQEAIKIDPYYAQAYAAIAEAYVILSDWGFYPSKEANIKVKEFALKALSIDGNSAEAYSALGLAAHGIEYNWEAAKEYYQKAILLNPNYATAHQWYSFWLSTSNLHDEAIEQAKLALQLDPMSLVMNQYLAFALYYARRYDEAIKQCEKALELDENFLNIYRIQYLCYLQKKMIPESVEVFKQALAVHEDTKIFIEEFDQAYEASGYKGGVRWIIENMDKWIKLTYVRPFIYAIAYAALDEKDKAFEWLEEAYKVNSRTMTTIGVDPALDSLRSDPRFDELLEKVGLKKVVP